MSALSEAADFARDAEFRPLLSAALERAAIDIVAEDPAADDHENRARLARRVLTSPEDPALLSQFQWAVSTNGTVVSKWLGGDQDGTAGDLAFVLGSLWNAVAAA